MDTEGKQRVIVYIDGFNFYYGLRGDRRWKKYYWLDVVKLFEAFIRPNQELVAVKYFSARPDDIERSRRQNAFFSGKQREPEVPSGLREVLEEGDHLLQMWECHPYLRGEGDGRKDCNTDRGRCVSEELRCGYCRLC